MFPNEFSIFSTFSNSADLRLFKYLLALIIKSHKKDTERCYERSLDPLLSKMVYNLTINIIRDKYLFNSLKMYDLFAIIFLLFTAFIMKIFLNI